VGRHLVPRGAVAILAAIGAGIAFASSEQIIGAVLAGVAIANVILLAVFVSFRLRSARRPPPPPPRRPH
jgi:hypothetical protein